MSEQYHWYLQPTSKSTMSPLWKTVWSGSWCGSAALAPKLTMGVKEWSCAPSRRYSPSSPEAICSSVTPSRTCAASHFMASSLMRLASRISARSRLSLIERTPSTTSDASRYAEAAPASISGSSQRAARSLSTPSGELWSQAAVTRGTGSSVSEKSTTLPQHALASGKRRLQKSVAVGSLARLVRYSARKRS